MPSPRGDDVLQVREAEPLLGIRGGLYRQLKRGSNGCLFCAEGLVSLPAAQIESNGVPPVIERRGGCYEAGE